MEIEDGRIALLTDPQKYDVMVTGIIHPKYNPGNAGLYSKDYYELCKSRLNDDGIMCQWIPLNALRESEFKMIIATFQNVFPNTSLWFEELFGGNGNYNAVLVGSRMPLKIDYGRIQQSLENPALASDLHEVGIDGINDLLNRFIISDSDLVSYGGQQPLISDNRPRLEFGTVEIKDFTKILGTLSQLKKVPWPYLTDLPLSQDRQAALKDSLTRLDKMAMACIQGDIYHWQNRTKDYLAQYQKAEELAPENKALRAQLALLNQRSSSTPTEESPIQRASALVSQGKLAEAVPIYEQQLAADPTRIDIRSSLGILYQKLGKTDQAIEQFQQVLLKDSTDSGIRNNLGIAYMQKGMYDKAESEFLMILKSNPDFVRANVNLGLIYARTNRKELAIQYLEKAQTLEPDNANIQSMLNQLRK